ncbi:hypothetical protein DFP72DRAFT_860395 [Ephemerocybe angulata]|uniref:Uncharacterized protein n=1 Tax=Ephemerocybe angulata TaxID=980116 RepID=A0A8H6H8V9_9AGAR|nr:hypothetical protein DFP72DRAFT_860395 [Tulosesus angulatus]
MRLTFIPALTALALGVASTFTMAYAYANHDNWDARSIIDPSSNTLDARYGSGIEVPFQPVLRDFLEEAVDAYRRHLSESESLEARAPPLKWYTFKYEDKDKKIHEQRMECGEDELVGAIKMRLGGLAVPAILAEGKLSVQLPAKQGPHGVMFALDEKLALGNQQKAESVNPRNPIWFRLVPVRTGQRRQD